MKKTLLFGFIIFLYASVTAQDADSIDVYIKQGVSLHDKGDYTKAISNYNKALKIDPNNITALAEKAFSLSSLQDYDNSIKICEQAISSDPQSDGLKIVYTTYANALDATKKPEEAVEIYNEGIALFPDYYQLYFNRGITLSGIQEFDEALLSFQASARLNPEHASSHNAIGRISMIGEDNIPALMAFGRFLIIEPQGSRAKSNLPFVQGIMSANVEKTGRNNITISIDPNKLADANKSETEENDFNSTDFLLSMSAALDYDKKNKKKTEVELFMSKFETVCASLQENQEGNYGFYWKYYVPYFIEMKDNNMIETFSYLVYASSENKYVDKWLSENETKIDSFYKWSSDFEWAE